MCTAVIFQLESLYLDIMHIHKVFNADTTVQSKLNDKKCGTESTVFVQKEKVDV